VRRVLVMAAAVAAATLTSAPVAGSPAAAVGWWTRSPVASAPAGGFEVAKAPDGALSVAAVRIDAGAAVTRGRLDLTQTEGAGDQVAAVTVCPAGDDWTPATGGDLAKAPPARCDLASVALTRGEGGAWTADVTALLASPNRPGWSLALVPDPGAPPYRLAFGPPDVTVSR